MDHPAEPRPTTGQAAQDDLVIWRLLRATPLAAWALVGIFGLLGVVYAIGVPLLHGPDEGAHVDRIAGFSLTDQFGVDPIAELRYSPDLFAAYEQVGIVPVDHRVLPRIPWTPLNTAEAAPLDQRPPYPDLAPPGTTDARFSNAARSHPPAYYVTVDALDAVVTTLGLDGVDEAPWDATLARWRVWSILLLLPMPWVAFWVAARLAMTTSGVWSGRRPSDRRAQWAGLVAAALTLAAPQLSHSAGTVNNDALLFAGTSLSTLAVAWMATGDQTRRTAAWAGVGAGVAMAAKIFGIGAPVWIVAAALAAGTAGSRDLPGLVRRAVPVAIAAVATIAAGGWLVIATFVQHQTLAPRAFSYDAPDALAPSTTAWLREVAERLTSTGFGRLGVEQFGIPGWSVWIATLATLLFLTMAFASPVVRGRTHVGVVLLLPLLTTLAMVLWAAWSGYQRSGVPSGLHGRYLFVGAPALAALAAHGLAHLVRLLRPHAPERVRAATAIATAAALATLLQGLGIVTTLASWWPGGWSDRIRTAMLFSGWSDPVLALVAVAAVATIAALAGGLRQTFAPEVEA